jgi:LCP family protein required for cell wall assembly
MQISPDAAGGWDDAPRRPRQIPGFLGVLAVTAAASTGGVLVAANSKVDQVQRVPGLEAVLDSESSTVENFLMIGSDSRAEGDPNTGTGAEVTGNRSDTIMILRRDRQTGTASLLSIPRDLWVQVPGRDGRTKINAAYNDGPAALIQTIRDNLGLPIHHYLEVDFNGFKALVDALGGVEMCFFLPTRDFNTGLDIPEGGCYVLNGTQSLAFARSRYYEELRDGEWRVDGTADLGRIKRQQVFVDVALSAAVTRIKVDPFAAGEIADALTEAIVIDTGLDPLAAASSLRTAVAGGVTTYSLPVFGDQVGDQSVLQLADGADAMLAFFAGTGPDPTQAVATPTP